MNKKEDIQHDLQNVYFVYEKETVSIPVMDSGIINDDVLQFVKKGQLAKAVVYSANELVRAKKDYPVDGHMDVELTVDAVLMPRKMYDKLTKYINE